MIFLSFPIAFYAANLVVLHIQTASLIRLALERDADISEQFLTALCFHCKPDRLFHMKLVKIIEIFSSTKYQELLLNIQYQQNVNSQQNFRWTVQIVWTWKYFSADSEGSWNSSFCLTLCMFATF